MLELRRVPICLKQNRRLLRIDENIQTRRNQVDRAPGILAGKEQDMSNLTQAAEAIIAECEDLEINIAEDLVEIYWQNLRVKCAPKDFPKAVAAIKSLIKLEAYFG